MINETFDIVTAVEALAETGALGTRRRLSVETMRRVASAWQLYEAAADGSLRAKATLQESFTRSDFPKLFGAALDAKLLAAYQSIAPIWQQFATRDTVPDFKAHSWVDVMGGQGDLPGVAEGAPYERFSLAEADGSYKVAKYGAGFGLTWEMFVDDRLGVFRSLPDRLATAAREKEDRIATAQLTNGAGPNSALFGANKVIGAGGATSSNLMASNPALSEESLEAALTAISIRHDYDDRPIVLRGSTLVVPPQLQTTAERIVGATEVRETVGSRVIVRTNPLAGRVKVVVNPWLLVYDTSANDSKTWYLLPDPAGGITSRPAVVVGFLAGHETPDLRVKNDQGTRVGGGSIDPMEGSFDDDSVQYRVRHVCGGTSVDAIETLVSNGTGSG